MYQSPSKLTNVCMLRWINVCQNTRNIKLESKLIRHSKETPEGGQSCQRFHDITYSLKSFSFHLSNGSNKEINSCTHERAVVPNGRLK